MQLAGYMHLCQRGRETGGGYLVGDVFLAADGGVANGKYAGED
jgi:hypothetical protein